MSEFAKDNLNSDDYETLNAMWRQQLCQSGDNWQPAYDWQNDRSGWRNVSDSADAPVQSLYDAWRQATGTPDDLGLGMTHEPPEPRYRKPV